MVRAFAELGSCCAWPPPWGGHAKVVSARLNPSHGTKYVKGVCDFLSSVSSQQKFEATDVKALGQKVSQLSDRPRYSSQLSDRSVLQLHFTPQFYLENEKKKKNLTGKKKKKKYILEALGHAHAKHMKMRESE